MSTLSGERLALCAVTMSPAVENTLSLGTDVAGIPRKCLANLAKWGNCSSLSFHHTSGFDSTERLCTLSGVCNVVPPLQPPEKMAGMMFHVPLEISLQTVQPLVLFSLEVDRLWHCHWYCCWRPPLIPHLSSSSWKAGPKTKTQLKYNVVRSN